MTTSFDLNSATIQEHKTYVSGSCVVAEFRVETSRHVSKTIYKRVGCFCAYLYIYIYIALSIPAGIFHVKWTLHWRPDMHIKFQFVKPGEI